MLVSWRAEPAFANNKVEMLFSVSVFRVIKEKTLLACAATAWCLAQEVGVHSHRLPNLTTVGHMAAHALATYLPTSDETAIVAECAATARCFAGKLGVQSDRVLNAVMNDRMVAKGLVLQWATAFFVDFLATEPMDDLVAILRKARRCPIHASERHRCVG